MILRATLLAVLVLVALSVPVASGNGDPDRRCRAVAEGNLRAEAIRAHRVGCRRARSVAREYLRYGDVAGWRCRTRDSGRRVCVRGYRRVGFNVVAEADADAASE
jgi:hypothetical protein